MFELALCLVLCVGGCTLDPIYIIVDLNASRNGNGTECSPFQSLNSALQLSSSNATIVLLPSTLPAISSTVLTIYSTLTLSGQQNIVILVNQITISQTGSLTLNNVTLQSQTQTPLFDTSGILIFNHILIESFNNVLFELHFGEVIIRNGNVTNQTAPFCIFHHYDTQLTLSSTNFNIIKSDLIQVLNYDNRGNSMINITNSTIYQIEGHLLNLKGTPLSVLQVSLDSVSIQTSTVSLFEGDLTNIALIVRYSVFSNMSQVAIGNAIESTFLFDQCQFSHFSTSLFTLSQLKGSVSILRSEISNIYSGPLISVPSNPYPFQSAQVTISYCNITNVTNTDSVTVSGICCGTSISLSLSHLNIYGLLLFRGGLFIIVGGMVSMSNIIYNNSSIFIYGTFEIYQSTFTISGVSVSNIENQEYLLTPIVNSKGSIDQITIVDTQSLYNSENFSSLVLFWSGFGSEVTITNSYFRNSGFTTESIVVSNSATLAISNLTFVDSIYQTLFSVFSGGYLEANGVTHIRAKAASVISCVSSSPCCSLANMVFLETFSLTYFILALNSNAVIKDSSFYNADYHFAHVISGQISIFNVTFSNSNITICNNCFYSVLYVNLLRLFQIESKLLFQVTSTSVNISNSVFTDINLDVVVEAFGSNITLDGCEISNLQADSYGGIISAEGNSMVIITNSHISNIFGKLSIKIGLIYVSASHLHIENCVFEKLNSTVIYSVKSWIDIAGSSFGNGGLYLATPNKAVKTIGGVLWSEDSAQLSIKDSQFLANSADFGGVLYLACKAVSNVFYYFTNCQFANNAAIQSGGVIFSSNAHISVMNSQFVGNSGLNGGALYLINTQLSISHSELTKNSAQLDGGGIDFFNSQLATSEISFLNNSAVYGPDLGSSGQTLVVIDADSLPVSNFSIESASGKLFSSTFSVAIIDAFGQILRTDNTTQITFSSYSDVSFQGVSTIQCYMGTFRVSKLGIIGAPGANITIIGTTKQISSSLFTVQLRNCIAGEYEESFECRQCLKNTYSLAFGKPCVACPNGAQCPGGSVLILETGYWRSATDSDHIMSCIVPELCFGDFDSKCAIGQSGKLCLECAPGYSKLNQVQCISCSYLSVSVLKSALSTLLGLGTVVLAASRGPEVILVHAVIFDYFHTLRSLANYVIYWPNAVGYLYSVLGDIGSVGLSAFTDPCLDQVAGTQIAFSQIVVSALYIGALLVLSLTAGVITWKLEFHLFLPISVYWLYCISPMVYLRALQMLAWVDIEDHLWLLSDPQVEYWSHAHQQFTYTLAIPLLILAIGLLLLLIFTRVKYQCVLDFSPGQLDLLIILLIRNYFLTSLLLFSDALVIYTQVGLVILINSTVEWLLKASESNPYSLYHGCLISSTILSFSIALYSAAKSSQRDKEYLFVFANYISICLPWVLQRYFRKSSYAQVTLHPVEDQNQSSISVDVPGVPFQSKISDS